MADTIVVAIVMAGSVLYLTMGWSLYRMVKQDRAREMERYEAAHNAGSAPPAAPPAPQVIPDAVLGELLARLMDAALPKRDEPEAQEGVVGSPGEYEAPDVDVMDWTDPFIGLEREMVGGLRPGEAIPGIGGTADDPYPPTDFNPDDWQRLGEEMGDQWLRAKDAGARLDKMLGGPDA